MKNLKPPTDIDHDSSFEGIINAKKDPSLVANLNLKKAKVLSRYIEYKKEFYSNSLIKIADSTFTKGDSELLSCYLSGGVKIAAIKKAIKDLQSKFGNEKCMYCQIKDPDSFDHYLPKDIYPEFCALAINLIPCCVTCNKKKDVYWKESGEIGIINFYLDKIPSKQFLFVKISFAKNNYTTPIISFELSNVNGINPASFKIFKKHFKKLELLERYNQKSDTEISELKRTLNSFGKTSSVSKNMQDTLDYSIQLKKDFGLNYWKAILFEELSKQKIFFTSNKI